MLRSKHISALIFAAVLLPAVSHAQQHPSIFITRAEAAAIRANAARYPLLERTLNDAKAMMATAFAAPMDVPQPGEAGGYAHERHKQNYREMQTAGTLYAITGQPRYAAFVRDMLDKYAVLPPVIEAPVFPNNNPPGPVRPIVP